jgi:uncharacterized HAD superfamily protein
MKIGIDLDGCAADTISPFLKFYNERHNSKYAYEEILTHDFWDLFGITREEAIGRMHDFYEQTEFDIIPVIGTAAETIKKLNEDNELIVITARPLIYKEKTMQWLEKHFPNIFSKVIFTNQYSKDHLSKQTTKAAICEMEGIDILVEDFDKYVTECAGVCKKVIVFDQPWNQNAKLPENAVRVKSWDEVLEEIIKF